VNLAASGLALSASPALLHADVLALHRASGAHTSGAAADEPDMRWMKALTGKHKAVYDSPDIGGGLGVFRAAIVKKQYMEAFKLPASAISNVVVLRHDGIALAMNQAFWDAYGIAKKNNVKHPWTGAPITKNPATLTPADGLPPLLAGADLRAQIAAGTIVLACNLAFADMVDLVATADKVPEGKARAKALSMMFPGVIMQPSGVFATTVAQEQGCVYVRAS
jgi:hypothetical protein